MTKMYKVGDRVKIVKKNEASNCAWNSFMDKTLKKTGVVTTATESKSPYRTQVQVDGLNALDGEWYYLPESIEPLVVVDFTKEVKDEMGNVLEILTTEAKGEFPVIYRNNHGSLYRASLDGKSESGFTALRNSITKGVGYVNIYRKRDGGASFGEIRPTLEESKKLAGNSSSDVIARVKVEFTEGVFQE